MKLRKSISAASTSLFLLASASPAQTPIADVKAAILATEFSCKVGVQDPSSSTSVPTKSIRFYLNEPTNLPFPSICMDMIGLLEIRVGFIIAYTGNLIAMKATAHSELNCSGISSAPSPNSCIVQHVITAPWMLP